MRPDWSGRVPGRAWVLPFDDIDTDQIIPARFLKSVSRSGAGAGLFADRRDGAGFPQRPSSGSLFVFAGSNFGCGSSREHAVWALVEAGVRGVFARSVAPIFRANAARNGLLAVAWPPEAPMPAFGAEATIDLRAQTVRVADEAERSFAIDPFDRHCLVHAVDEFAILLGELPLISAYEAARMPAENHAGGPA